MRYIEQTNGQETSYLSGSLQISPYSIGFLPEIASFLEASLNARERVIFPTMDECSYEGKPGAVFSRNLGGDVIATEVVQINTLDAKTQPRAAITMGYLLADLINRLNSPAEVKSELDLIEQAMQDNATYVLPQPTVQLALLTAYDEPTQSVCVRCPNKIECHAIAATILSNDQQQRVRKFRRVVNTLEQPSSENFLEL